MCFPSLVQVLKTFSLYLCCLQDSLYSAAEDFALWQMWFGVIFVSSLCFNVCVVSTFLECMGLTGTKDACPGPERGTNPVCVPSCWF